jgi:hypothetical protein
MLFAWLYRQQVLASARLAEASLSNLRSDTKNGAEVPDLEEIQVNICRAILA